MHNLWIDWTETWGGKYNAEEPSDLPGRALARFTRWWTTVRGWSKSDIPKGLFDKRNKRMKVRRAAPFSSDHPLSTTVPNRLSGCVSEANYEFLNLYGRFWVCTAVHSSTAVYMAITLGFHGSTLNFKKMIFF